MNLLPVVCASIMWSLMSTGVLLEAAVPSTDGNWTVWFNVNVSSCDNATRTRAVTQHRTCTNPPPSSDGMSCVGRNIRTFMDTCNMDIYTVDGNWTVWFNVNATCCDDATRNRTVTQRRTCTNPPPSRDGNLCDGPSTQTFIETCNTDICNVDGNWTEWFNVNITRTDTTTNGTHIQRRTCTNPPPSGDGKACVGRSTRFFIEL